MADSTWLMHGFSYASAIPDESKQGNPMHVLGESISFGRFMTDSEPLSWSSFSSHKKYVEEARRYAQPGSVAQKKAFFEAHYKRIAAQKAAALLEQQNAAKIAEDDSVPQLDESGYEHEDCTNPSPISEVRKEVELGVVRAPIINQLVDCLENQDMVSVSVSDGCGTPQTTEERPLLKQEVTSKKKSGLSTLKSTIQRKTWKVPSTPAKSFTPFGNVTNLIQSSRKSSMEAMDKTRSSPKSLHQVMNSITIKASDKVPVSAIKKTARTPNNFKTPWKTPVRASSKYGGASAATPMSENRRMKTPIEPSTPGIKTTGPKWHILSAVCSKSLTSARKKLESPTVSTPFVLRTEERAAKRKQKLEEKFNANEVQKEKTLKEKAGKEFKKLSCSLCFKARPLPEFYSERGEASVTKMKKSQPQLGKTVTNKKPGNILMPSALQPRVENGGASKISIRKDDTKPSKLIPFLHPGRRIRGENISPNHSALIHNL